MITLIVCITEGYRSVEMNESKQQYLVFYERETDIAQPEQEPFIPLANFQDTTTANCVNTMVSSPELTPILSHHITDDTIAF